jgi:thymidine kinase
MKNDYEIIDGIVHVKIVTQKHGEKIFTVNQCDFDIVNGIYGTWGYHSTNGYAKYSTTENGKRKDIFLHRLIMGVNDSSQQVDHINGDRLNNQRNNLRVTDVGGNSQNISVKSNSTTGIRGVSFREDRGYYVSQITTYGKTHRLGSFKNVDIAEKHVKFARTILVPMAVREEQFLSYAVEYDKPMLYFRHGSMSSGKSELLLISNNVYQKLGKKVILLSSTKNTRDGEGLIKSRNGMSAKSIAISDDDNIFDVVSFTSETDYILVDEIHFFTKKHIEQLRRIVDNYGVTVICYGLKVDFKSKLFDTVDELICLSDVIQGIPHECECGGNAIMNMRLSDGVPVFHGKTIEVGAEERYKAVCRKCFFLAKQNKESEF